MKATSLLILFLFVSCGTRKTELNKSTSINTNIEVDNSRILEQDIALSIIPFDPKEPMIIAGKSFHNVIIKHEKKSKETIFDKRIITKTYDVTKTKLSEKTDNTILYIGFFLVLVLGILAWFKLPSFRKDI